MPQLHNETPVAATVTVQVRREWPARTYSFSDPRQARMFERSCRNDGDFRVQFREMPL